MKKNKPRILFYDLETSYTVGAVWGLYDQNVSKVLRDPYILTFAYKWLGEKQTHVVSLPDFSLYNRDKRSDAALVKKLWELFDEADIIVAHNGISFDQKWAYGRFIVNGMQPPSPSQYVDTKVVAKNKFRFNSNKLDDIARYFGLGRKIRTDIDLWVDIVENDDKSAWRKMEIYNKMDVILLEKIYLKMLPFMTNHPNIGVIIGEKRVCPNCGSSKIQKRGLIPSGTTLRQSWYCWNCHCRKSSPIKDGTQIR